MSESIPYRPTCVPKMSTVFENGTTAIAATAVTIEMTGAKANRKPTAVLGCMGSLVANLRISASGWQKPNGPTRLGP